MGSIPFEIPAKFAAGLAENTLERFGGIIKNTANGQIVAHLQETGVANKLLSDGGLSLISPLNPASCITSISSVASNIQLVQIKSMLNTMQMLQFASLGTAIVGIGVCAIGFTKMNSRFDQTQRQISDLSCHIDEKFHQLELNKFRQHKSKVTGLLDEAELAWSYLDSKKKWKEVSDSLVQEASYYLGEVENLLNLDKFDEGVFLNLINLLALCNSARFKCLILAEELEAAKQVAIQSSNRTNLLLDSLSPISLAKKTIKVSKKNAEYSSSLLNEIEVKKDIVSAIRDRQDMEATRPLFIDYLVEKSISGKEVVNQLEEENEHPIICFTT